MAGIKTPERRQDGPEPVAAQTPSMDGDAGCPWLMVAAERAGLASANGWSPPDPAVGWDRLPRIAMHTLGTSAGSVRAARDFTLATLHQWSMAERSDDIAIVVSELLTNAMRHAPPAPGGNIRPRRPIRLGLLQPGPCVLCAVADPGRAAPVPQAPGFLAEAGRGLHIICALSDRWGYTLNDTGKVVWAAFTSRLAAPLPAR